MQRESLASRLEESKKRLDGFAATASRAGALDAINDIETGRKRLDKVVARVRYADRGYAGFFATIKVDEAALDRVYRYDLGLLQGVEEARAAVAAGASNPAQAVKEMIGRLDALDAALGERESILNGIGEGAEPDIPQPSLPTWGRMGGGGDKARSQTRCSPPSPRRGGG